MKKTIYFLAVIFLSITLFNCPGPDKGDDVLVTGSNPFKVDFKPFAPMDLSANATPTDLVNFAWEEFIALTWKSSYATNGKRDYPDTTWNWTNDSSPYPDLVVWETYAHRTELRPYSDVMQPFDNPPHYSFGDALTQGTNAGGQPASFTLFNNLDENSEIGSCDVYGHADIYDKEDMVLYQAKCNRDEYDYVYNNYKTKAKLLAATSKTQSNITKYNAYYPGATSTCNCPADSMVICQPCGGSINPATGQKYQGSMEIKTAWRILVSEDDPSDFFTRDVIYYDQTSTGDIVYNNQTFGLIGIHIIHKTTNYPAYVFATWEHVDVEADNMGYILLNGSGEETGTFYKSYPRINGPLPDIVNQSTDSVHQQMKSMNPNSVWLNYRLVGVQGKPTNDTTSFSFFLANYVIESDTTLAHFRGSSIGNPHDNKDNVLLNGQKYSMGGCKGCHGVAQLTLGTDFSFLLDTVGKPVFQPDLLDSLPPIGSGQATKLTKYINATKGKPTKK